MSATIDSAANIRSHYAPLGPVCVFGPNNFPFAFGSVAGGDAAAALAAGNPIIAKANSSHPGTTRLFAEAALEAIEATDMPRATIQLLYRLKHADGERLVADHRVGATAYTGSRQAGLALKAAADAAGKPIYLELSSINPVVILPGALNERGDEIAQEMVVSGLMGTGQFCTNPGVVLLAAGESTDRFIEAIGSKYRETPPGVLLSQSVQKNLRSSIDLLRQSGATLLTDESAETTSGFRCANTLLQVSGDQFLSDPETFQTEAFGNCTLLVVANSSAQIAAIVDTLEGNLTGCIYSHTQGSDDEDCMTISARMRPKVGRLLNDKMPTGVAVSPAMNHGGPYPATGHPGFTAVGIPASIHRFAALHCYDNVRAQRLPACLQNANPNGAMWRLIDGQWTQSDVG
jgi:NADP-dependent aldehyde dehydrogenase